MKKILFLIVGVLFSLSIFSQAEGDDLGYYNVNKYTGKADAYINPNDVDNTVSYAYGGNGDGKPYLIEFMDIDSLTQPTFAARFTDSSIVVDLTQDTWVKLPGATFTAYYEQYATMAGDSISFSVGGTAFDCFVSISGKWSANDSISMALFYDNEIIGCSTIEAPGNVLAPIVVGAITDVTAGNYFSIGFMNISSGDDITLFCGTIKIKK